MTDHLSRLRAWAQADVGYTSGPEGLADVMALLQERDRLRQTIDMIADMGMDAKQCMTYAKIARGDFERS